MSRPTRFHRPARAVAHEMCKLGHKHKQQYCNKTNRQPKCGLTNKKYGLLDYSMRKLGERYESCGNTRYYLHERLFVLTPRLC